MVKEKILKFDKFLNERTYTMEEIYMANSIDIKQDMMRWNRLVKITKKEFEKLFH